VGVRSVDEWSFFYFASEWNMYPIVCGVPGVTCSETIQLAPLSKEDVATLETSIAAIRSKGFGHLWCHAGFLAFRLLMLLEQFELDKLKKLLQLQQLTACSDCCSVFAFYRNRMNQDLQAKNESVSLEKLKALDTLVILGAFNGSIEQKRNGLRIAMIHLDLWNSPLLFKSLSNCFLEHIRGFNAPDLSPNSSFLFHKSLTIDTESRKAVDDFPLPGLFLMCLHPNSEVRSWSQSMVNSKCKNYEDKAMPVAEECLRDCFRISLNIIEQRKWSIEEKGFIEVSLWNGFSFIFKLLHPCCIEMIANEMFPSLLDIVLLGIQSSGVHDRTLVLRQNLICFHSLVVALKTQIWMSLTIPVHMLLTEISQLVSLDRGVDIQKQALNVIESLVSSIWAYSCNGSEDISKLLSEVIEYLVRIGNNFKFVPLIRDLSKLTVLNSMKTLLQFDFSQIVYSLGELWMSVVTNSVLSQQPKSSTVSPFLISINKVSVELAIQLMKFDISNLKSLLSNFVKRVNLSKSSDRTEFRVRGIKSKNVWYFAEPLWKAFCFSQNVKALPIGIIQTIYDAHDEIGMLSSIIQKRESSPILRALQSFVENLLGFVSMLTQCTAQDSMDVLIRLPDSFPFSIIVNPEEQMAKYVTACLTLVNSDIKTAVVLLFSNGSDKFFIGIARALGVLSTLHSYENCRATLYLVFFWIHTVLTNRANLSKFNAQVLLEFISTFSNRSTDFRSSPSWERVFSFMFESIVDIHRLRPEALTSSFINVLLLIRVEKFKQKVQGLFEELVRLLESQIDESSNSLISVDEVLLNEAASLGFISTSAKTVLIERLFRHQKKSLVPKDVDARVKNALNSFDFQKQYPSVHGINLDLLTEDAPDFAPKTSKKFDRISKTSEGRRFSQEQEVVLVPTFTGDLLVDILKWSLNGNGDRDSSLKPVPLDFSSAVEYQKCFYSVLLEECKAGLQSKFEESLQSFENHESSNSSCLELHFLKQKREGDKFILTFQMNKRPPEDVELGLHNVLLLCPCQSEKDSVPFQETLSKKSFAMAIVSQGSDSRGSNRIQLLANADVVRSVCEEHALSEGKKWIGTRVSKISSELREFQALQSVTKISLFDELVSSRKWTPCTDSSIDSEIQWLDSNLNDSQRVAISRLIKLQKGFFLIQGPPGTVHNHQKSI